jgi:hypothetical protein
LTYRHGVLFAAPFLAYGDTSHGHRREDQKCAFIRGRQLAYP